MTYKQTSPNLISSWKVELETSKKYTRKIFICFQAKLGKLVDLRLYFESGDEHIERYRVMSLSTQTMRLVIYVVSTQSISCTCRMFEF